jgi:predicted nucleotidyltransferase
MVETAPQTAPDRQADLKMEDLTLPEVAATVATHLKQQGVEVVVVGGSAITAHVPDVYTSMDIDFAVTAGIDRRKISGALLDLGFKERGRVFASPETLYTLDFVADTPYIDQRAISEYVELRTSAGTFRVYRLEDAIADRIAAFVHWSDSESLDVAERAVAATKERTSWELIEAALSAIETLDADATARMELARSRLRVAAEG